MPQSPPLEHPWHAPPADAVDWLPLLPPSATQVLDCGSVTDDLPDRFAMVQPRAQWRAVADLRQATEAVAQAHVVLYRDRLAAQDPAIVLGHHVPRLAPDAVVLAWFPNSFDPPTLQRMLRRAHLAWARIDHIGGDPARGWIVRAGRGQPPSPLLIQTMVMAPEACQFVRVLEPDRASGTIPGVRTLSALRTAKLSAAHPGEARVFIFQRAIQSPQRDATAFERLAQAGCLIVAEYDDLPSRWPGNVESNFYCLRAAHAVQTSTPPLREWIARHNPHVEVFENQLAYLPPPRELLDVMAPSPVRVFFGALNREQDWAPLREPIVSALRDAGERVHVEVIHDRAFFEALDTPHKSFTPFCSYEQYHAVLRRCHIALLPLADTPFNRCKSDLKFLECAGHGAAVLASPTVYAQSVEHERTGLLCEDGEAFGEGLRRLIGDAALRRSLGQAARQWVADHRLLGQHYPRRTRWYRDLLARLPELESARRARL